MELYRVTAIRDSAKQLAKNSETLAGEYRANGRGSRDVDYQKEIRVAREQGKAEAFRWAQNELDALGELPGPGDASGTHGLYCEPCANNIAQLPRLAAAYVDAVSSWGLGHRYTTEPRDAFNNCVKALTEASKLHKEGRPTK